MNSKTAKTNRLCALLCLALAYAWDMLSSIVALWFNNSFEYEVVRASWSLVLVIAVLLARKHKIASVFYGVTAMTFVWDLFSSIEEYDYEGRDLYGTIAACVFAVFACVVLIYMAVKYGVKNKKHGENASKRPFFTPAVLFLLSDLCNIFIVRDLLKSPVESTVLTCVGMIFLGLYYYEISKETCA